MRPTILLTATVLVGLLAATSAVAARARHTTHWKCPPAHEEVIAADAQAVVY